MKRLRNIWYILLPVVLSLVYTWYEANTPRPPDWKESYAVQDKIPYGTYIAYQSLPLLFPHAKVESVHLPILEQLQQCEEKEVPVSYVFVNSHFIIDEIELHALLEFVERGNSLFIAAWQMPDTLLAFFSLGRESSFTKRGHRFTRPELSEEKYIFYQDNYEYFVLKEQFNGEVLGKAADQPDFVRLSYGEGDLFLNLNPRAFTNYCILDSIGDYYYKALSYLPDKGLVLWDEYQVLGPMGGNSPFRVILQHPALRWALWLLLLGGLLYALFRLKREQRAIPVIRPFENKTLEFVTAVSSLYYRHKDHYAIANKRIDFFMEEVRYRYKLQTNETGEHFIKLLSDRSGVEKAEVSQLIKLIEKIRKTRQITPETLRKLEKQIEQFKK